MAISGGTLEQRKAHGEQTRNKIIELIINKPGITVNEMAENIGITFTGVFKQLKNIKADNLVFSKRVCGKDYYFPVGADTVTIENALNSVPTNTRNTRNRKHEYSEATANKVIELIRNRPYITTNELLLETNIDRSTICRVTNDYEAKGVLKSSRSSDPTRNPKAKCYWLAASETPEPTVAPAKEENEVERYPEHKNDEGYNDLTAAPTIRKMDDIFGVFAPGAVWTLSTAYGADVEYLVLRSYKGWVTGMMLQDDIQQYSPVYCVPVSMGDKRYVDCRRILTKPSKYFVEKKYDIPNLERVRSKVCYLLGIEPEVIEKIVEKPVEVVKEVPVEVIKEIEKPVEVIKEVPVEVIKEVVKEVEVEKSVDAVDTALLRQKAEIYEKIAWQFLNSIASVAEEVER